jgi:hypothetical protein
MTTKLDRMERLMETDELLQKMRVMYTELRDAHSDLDGNSTVYDMAVQGMKKCAEVQYMLIDLLEVERRIK